MTGLCSFMTTSKETISVNQTLNGLQTLLEKRTGGSINIRGIHYQLLYSCWLMLDRFKSDDSDASIRLEGIEDVDFTGSQLSSDKEYIQLKSSVNNMDAGAFWNIGVLQNFATVYKSDPQGRFKLVYNMKIADGKLSGLVNGKLNPMQKAFWDGKLQSIGITNSEEFLSRLTFEQHTANELVTKLQKTLLKDWNINHGTELQYLRSLFFNVLEWSKERATVSRLSIKKLFQEILDSYSKAPVNEAIKHEWISAVDFNSAKSNLEEYYDGQAARPSHIGMGLPVHRKAWERTIKESIKTSDVTVIRSSSGQGKSTLAWQVGYQLLQEHSLYQLDICRDAAEANAAIEFLKSRLSIGEIPLVIVDGLNALTENWAAVVSKTQETPLKYLITSRQEDWHRFGADISKIKVSLIDVFLSRTEAQEVYELLKKKGKLHADIEGWQPVWEQVSGSGLLIEYAYLLTRGQMLHSRLEAQLISLGKGKGSGAKLELLRMIAAADTLYVKLDTSRLLNYVKNEIGFDGVDRGELLNELKKEYYIDFDGHFVVGLHPVRSTHLSNLLHTSLPLSETFFNLYNLLDEGDKQTYFTNAILLIPSSQKKSFIANIAKLISDGKFSEMVYALDGIMHSLPQRYWLEHKAIFDEAYQMGGGELFTSAAIPFPAETGLGELAASMGNLGKNIAHLHHIQQKLPAINFKDNDLALMAKALEHNLSKRTTPVTSYEGLEWIFKWFELLALNFSCPVLRDTFAINELLEMDINDSKELMLYFQLKRPADFKAFTDQHKTALIGYLKVQTNSLTIVEKENDIHINYLLFDHQVPKANELSIYRIQTIFSFLPFYDQYHTEAILLPFPNEDIVSAARQASIKHLTRKAISNIFQQHLNKIWASSLEVNYQASSVYHWQEGKIAVRRIGIDWATSISRFIDSLLEGNEVKRKKEISELQANQDRLVSAIIKQKSYPRYGKKYYDSPGIPQEQKAINYWQGALSNLNRQLNNIFQPETEHQRHIALINLRQIYYELPLMQSAFKEVEQKTFSYFDTAKIIEAENLAYHRLYITISYYLSQLPLETKAAVQVGKKAAADWWLSVKDQKLELFNKTLKAIADKHRYQFNYPINVKETATLSYVTFGVTDFDFSDLGQFFEISMALAPLANLPFDFYTIVAIKNNVALGALRFKQVYFEAFQDLQLNGLDVKPSADSPLPVEINDEVLKFLPGIEPRLAQPFKQELELEVRIIYNLWNLSEIRKRLDPNVESERKWLVKSEQYYIQLIEKKLSQLKAPSEVLTDAVKRGLQPGVVLNQSEILNLLFKSSEREIAELNR